MDIRERVTRILMQPKTEWEVIAGEPAPMSAIYRHYIIPLAAIGPVAAVIGMSVFGMGQGYVKAPLGSALGYAVVIYAFSLISVWIMSWIINWLAPLFGGAQDHLQAFKVATYASTPNWVAGIFMMVPIMGLVSLAAGIYGLYLFYLGLPVLMRCPQKNALAYTMVVIVLSFIANILLSRVNVALLGQSNLF